MKNFERLLVSLLPICLLVPAWAKPLPGLASGGVRTRRDVPCRDHLEYPHSNICCLNCPAGAYVKSPCTRAGERGTCEECDYGTFTEHANGLRQCFKCTQCRSDQETVRPCSHSQDTECRCKTGRFCDPDQACEVCKKCSRCGSDEEIVRNCTSTANTECKKTKPKSDSDPGWSVALIVIVVMIVVSIIAFIMCFWLKKRRRTDGRRNPPDGTKAGPCYIDARPMEDESLSSSASNSQHSLTGLLPPACPASAPLAAAAARPTTRREEEQFPKLEPVNGFDSLRQCFWLFEELDASFYKRFFRLLGLNDNVIKGEEHSSYEDKIHDLLNIWMEQEGRDASLNDLLSALLELNQRRTAEVIMEKAIGKGHYRRES
ncbi:hematopoietic death receptor [Embiotoca jacksoni]|uniref:hematopoietic death receptor n=1 Tax=Embiotoca jacksoni TaxID=100190 RepID=UPI003704B692